MGWLHCVKRSALYILIIFLGSLWTIVCFVVINARVCCIGWMANYAEGRSGGCHDVPLIRAGCEEFWEESLAGWSWLCSLIAPESEYYDEEMAPQDLREVSAIEQPIVRPPDAVQ
jgi:hypothetical protein